MPLRRGVDLSRTIPMTVTHRGFFFLPFAGTDARFKATAVLSGFILYKEPLRVYVCMCVLRLRRDCTRYRRLSLTLFARGKPAIAIRVEFHYSPNYSSSAYVPRDVAGVSAQAPRGRLSPSSESFPNDAARSPRPASSTFAWSPLAPEREGSVEFPLSAS